jgi:predicted ester cyclase
MSSGDNRDTLIRLLEEAGPALDFDYIDQVVHPDVVLPEHLPGGGQGREALKEGLRAYADGFEGTTRVQDAIVDGDKVAVRIVTKAKHTGELFGIPATGRDFHVDEIMIAEFRDGKVVRFSRVADLYSLMQQLGGAPTP